MLCYAEKCSNESKFKGLCRKHYLQMWRHGRITDNDVKMKSACIVEGCSGKYWGKGYCIKHYGQVRKHGRLTPELEKHKPGNCIVCGIDSYRNGFCKIHYKEYQEKTYKKCKVENCNHIHSAHGFCKTHYSHWKKYGDPLKYVRNMIGTICTVEHCGRKAAGNGLCKKHWAQMHRIGRILKPDEELHLRWHKHPTGKCSYPGCNKKHYIEGFCKTHTVLTRKIKVIEIKGGKCSNCGYNKCVAALDLHHIDKSTKDLKSPWILLSWKKVMEEVDKCILLCSNCHRELHYKEKHHE